eukprot:scaffold67627_cov82-Phaeocystis_antarctica.AAC.3
MHALADVGAQPPRKDDFKVRTTDSGENRPRSSGRTRGCLWSTESVEWAWACRALAGKAALTGRQKRALAPPKAALTRSRIAAIQRPEADL